MKRGIHLDANTKLAIIKALKSGQRPLDIERMFRVSDRTVARIRRQLGIADFRRRPTREERIGILDAIEKGQSSATIAATFKRSRSFICKIRHFLVATRP
jgi:hypothetical protein